MHVTALGTKSQVFFIVFMKYKYLNKGRCSDPFHFSQVLHSVNLPFSLILLMQKSMHLKSLSGEKYGAPSISQVFRLAKQGNKSW